MGRKLMINNDISNAKDPDLRNALAALRRASLMARKIAIQTGTNIVVIRDGKIIRISADELRRQEENSLSGT
jgi:hypothetical protein